MNEKFCKMMAADDHSYYPLRFLASTYFVRHWSLFADCLDYKEDLALVQRAARECVDILMGGEEIYWNVSFEFLFAYSVWSHFDKMISGLTPEKAEEVRIFCIHLAASREAVDGAEFFMNVVNRLRLDREVRALIKYSDYDGALLDIAYEQPGSDYIDMQDVKDEFLNSSDEWDRKLMAQTPDLPESVWVIFAGAYEVAVGLARLRRNLQLLLPDRAAYMVFMKRLKIAFDQLMPVAAVIQFPKAMLFGELGGVE